MSPKANRNIPPLEYNFIKKIKKQYPKINFILNGGIDSLEKAKKLSSDFDGLMLGRLIQTNPFLLKNVDNIFFDEKYLGKIDEDIILNYFEYIRPKLGNESIFRLLSPILQIFFGVPKSKDYKMQIHQNIKDEKIDLIESLLLQFVKHKKLVLN